MTLRRRLVEVVEIESISKKIEATDTSGARLCIRREGMQSRPWARESLDRRSITKCDRSEELRTKLPLFQLTRSWARSRPNTHGGHPAAFPSCR